MIDSNSQFFAILTAVGEAKQANATALGIPWTFKDMAVGDANGTDPVPDRAQTKLINEWRRAPVNQVRTDPANPNLIITEQVIPSDVGGRWIREIGLYDAAGDLVAVANCAPSFKPLLAQGTGKTQIIRMNFIVSNTAQIVLKIDPAVVLATRQYVDDSLATALPANKTPGTYRQVTIDKRGIVVSGSNPTTLAGYGITDAFTKPETSAAINQAVAALVAAAPGALDTLKELADALGNDPNFATTMTNALAGKAAKATTLAGYGITDAMKKLAGGIEAQAVPSSNNLDTVSSSGLNSFHASTANRPAGSTYGTVLHISYDQPTGNWTQLAVATGDSRAWFRGCVNGSLQAWQEIWSSGNLNPGNLQQKLGFTPVQQGTGHGQGSNTVKIGWSTDQSPRLKLTVDNTYIGDFWTSSDFNPADYIKKGQILGPGESPKCMSAATGTIGGISGDASGLEVRGNGNGAAVISFHRPGIYGVHLGLDTDSQLKIGGWSMGGVAHTILHTGNCDMTGAIVHFPFPEPPTGFLRANGTAVSRSAYPRLFARIGTTYGAGDGSTTFNLPDWRGVFVRGLDEGRGLDPGRALATFQFDQFQGHAQSAPPGASGFTVYAPGQGGASAGGGINTAPKTGGVVSDGVNGNPRVGAETRPVNIAFLACIKY
ncbi:phage tail protein [Pseudomonas piscis]|uniref:phage tail-collar fiber domain-containing protein n=1 Tax=Pseudomonas piscis TaxID=2614538 RepID=UPI003242D830